MLKISVVEIKGVEPLTSCLQGRRSSQTELYPQIKLKYKPKKMYFIKFVINVTIKYIEK